MAWVCAIALFAAGAPAVAQEIRLKEPDISKTRMRIGPVALDPTIELTNLGVDTNVFNEPDPLAKQDFTFTLRPRTDAWMKMGPTWITGNVRADVIWYQEHSSERAGNGYYTLGWTVPLNRLAFGVQGFYLHAHERPGFEIDTRAERSELNGKAAVEYRALPNTYVGIRGGRQRVDFDDDQFYNGQNLQTELNRTVSTAALTVRHQLTPLTALTIDAGTQEDRFEFSPLRNSESTTAGVEISFDPFALLKGSARIGYRDFMPADPKVPGYSGMTAAVDLTYVLQGSTKVSFQLNRDIQYSFDGNQPYYLQTGVNGSIAQQIYGPLDVVFRLGNQHLDYRDRVGAAVAAPSRTDLVHIYGGGAGYHVGPDLRIGFDIEKQKRISEEPHRNYEALRFGISMTYGL